MLVIAVVRADQPSAALRNSILSGSHHGRPAEILSNAGLSAERICRFGPYSPADTINEVLGFEWPAVSSTGIHSSDIEELVLAANSKRVVAWAMVPRGVADFLVIDGYGCAVVIPLHY